MATTLAGWLGLPRTGCGARKGESVSVRIRSSGTIRAASRSASDLRVGEVAGERAVPAALGGALGPARAGREAVEDHLGAVRLGLQGRERLGDRVLGAVPVPEVDHQRLAGCSARSRSGRRRPAAGRPDRRGRGRSRARSPRPRPPAARRRAPRSPPPPPGRSRRRRSDGARRTRRPPRASPASSTAPGFESSPRPTVSTRRTPASRAAAIRAESSGSQSPRWAWVSTTPPSLGARGAIARVVPGMCPRASASA